MSSALRFPGISVLACFCVALLWRLLTQFLHVFQRNRMMDVIFSRSSSPWLRNRAGTMQGSYPCPLRSRSGNQPIPAQGSHGGGEAACSFWNLSRLISFIYWRFYYFFYIKCSICSCFVFFHFTFEDNGILNMCFHRDTTPSDRFVMFYLASQNFSKFHEC